MKSCQFYSLVRAHYITQCALRLLYGPSGKQFTARRTLLTLLLNKHCRFDCNEMFNKKPRRNFRQRKRDSSDEEEKQANSGDGEEGENVSVIANILAKVAHGRGISCSSKREVSPSKPDSRDGDDGGNLELTTDNEEERGKNKEDIKKNNNTVLSFSDDKEGNWV